MLQQAARQSQKSMQQKTAASIRSSYLEVEKKFWPPASLKAQLNACASSQDEQIPLRLKDQPSTFDTMAGLRLLRLPDKKIRDVYYDLNNRLSGKGIWVRYRQTRVDKDGEDMLDGQPRILKSWEAKVQVAGTYTDDQAMEIAPVCQYGGRELWKN